MNVRAERFPLFDGLRALAALSVVAFHAAFFARLGVSDNPLRPYASHLMVGVTLFFLISGFLLYRPFVRARLSDEQMPGAAAYGWRRFLRIAPAYWVALTVVAIWLALPGVFTLTGIPTYYGFAQIYDAARSPGGISQAWTLCVEVTFYAFLPLWALAMRRLPGRGDLRRMVRQELVALALLFVASVAYKVWALQQTTPISLANTPYLDPLPNFLDQFALGMGLAVLSVQLQGREQLPKLLELVRRRPTLPWIVSGVAFWAVSTQIGLTGRLVPRSFPAHTFLERHELYSVIALGLVLPAVFVAPGRGIAGRLLGSRLARYLGLVSYSIYLYHFAVIKQIDRWLGAPLDAPMGVRIAVYLALGALGAVAIATLSYYLVERPALSLKRLVRDRALERARGEAIVEPAPVAPPTLSRG